MTKFDRSVGELAMLIGGKITAVTKSIEEIGIVYGLEIHTTDGKKKTIWLLSDFEGNAPGAWDIEDETN